MGISLGGGQSSSSGKSSTVETDLSKQQSKILQSRESQYQAYFFPELIQMLNENRQPAALATELTPQVQAVNSAYVNAKDQTNKDLQRRGIADSGLAVASTQALQSARVSTLADAYFKAQQAKEEKRLQLLQMGGSLSPTPTTAAPMGQVSSNKSSAWNVNGAFSAV